MKIKIYGAEGCEKCSKLEERAENIVEELVLDADVEKIGDLTVVANKGLVSTPAFEIDGEIIFKGSIPPKEELKEIIEEHSG